MKRRTFTRLLNGATLVSGLLGTTGDARSDEDLLATLVPTHPRLLLEAETISRAKQLIGSDERAKVLFFRLRNHGEALLAQPAVSYRLIGPRLLTESRKCVERVYVFSTLYLLQQEARWLDGVRNNLRSAANFPDWNPSHFLDVAEMTHAFAIAYDWLYEVLPEDDRRVIREAIVEKGLLPGIKTGYEAGEGGTAGGWAKATNNWNQVCNGGMTLGALAIADEQPELARRILAGALASAPTAMKAFAPDGGWFEGVAYWRYTLRYLVPMLAGLQTALGKTFGIEDSPGFAETGEFYLHSVGPTGLPFNYADGGAKPEEGFPWLHWMARRFDRPVWHWAASERATGEHPLSLLWYEPEPASPAWARSARDRVFVGIHAAMMRSSWQNPQASYFGFYAGHNGVSHSQLEMGTFVFDAMGARWVDELGWDDYDLPGYFGKDRWNYYRLNSHGQNVMLFDNQQQQVPARGRITSSGADNGSAYAIADLTEGYAGMARSVRRGMRLYGDRRALMVQDEFELQRPAVYQWQIHTRAEVQVDLDRALLAQGEKLLEVRAVSRTPLDFVLEPARAETLAGGEDKTENSNADYRKLVIRTRQPVERGTVAVLLHPLANPRAPRAASFVRPLAAWD
jgi:hypothetical protein